jgi:hypothetical protein
MVKDTDPVLTKVMNDLKRVTDVTRILDEQEKLNAPLPHYNKPMSGATDPEGNGSNKTNATKTGNATAPADAAPADGATPAAAAPADGAAPATDLPPELDPAAAGALKTKSSTAGNATQGTNQTK